MFGRSTRSPDSVTPVPPSPQSRRHEPGERWPSFVAGVTASRAPVQAGYFDAAIVELGSRDDPAERAAERAADTVVSGGQPSALEGPSPAVETVVRRHVAASSADAPRVAMPTTSPGRPLDSTTRAYFEPRFGRSFADVRVHDDTAANDHAESLSADAFTFGSDIYFRRGLADPHSSGGRRLFAHELAHVLQQRGRSPAVQRQATSGSPSMSPTATHQMMQSLVYWLIEGKGPMFDLQRRELGPKANRDTTDPKVVFENTAECFARARAVWSC